MNLGINLDVNDMPEESGFAPLPVGWYQTNIVSAEIKTSNAGDSTYMNIRYDIQGPSHQGRVVYGMCGVTNNDPKKEETSRYFMGQLMRACGLQKLTDTDQLIGCHPEIQLTLKPAVMETINGQEVEKYPAGNNIKTYRSMSGSTMPSATGEATGGAKPPWQK